MAMNVKTTMITNNRNGCEVEDNNLCRFENHVRIEYVL